MTKAILETAKIVAVGQADHWSQVHIFVPKDQAKLKQFGVLLAVLNLKTEAEEVLDLGKELIQRLHELYYASQANKPLTRLKAVFKQLGSDFDQPDLELSLNVGVILSSAERVVFYGGQLGQNQQWLKRADQVIKLVDQSTQLISGWLEVNDWLVIGNQEFFQVLDSAQLQTALGDQPAEEAAASLAPQIAEIGGTAILVKLKAKALAETDDQPGLKPAKAEFKPAKLGRSLRLKERLTEASELIKTNFQTLKQSRRQPPAVYSEGNKIKFKSKRLGLTVALILIVLLIFSLIFGRQKQQARQIDQQLSQVFSQVDQRLDEGQSLLALNPLRAKVLFDEARSLLEAKQAEYETDSAEYERLAERLAQVKTVLAEISHQHETEGELWLDLSLVKDDFRGDDWDINDQSLLVWDQDNSSLLAIKLETKAAEIVAGGDKLKSLNGPAAVDQTAWLFGQQKIMAVNLARKTSSPPQADQDWGQIITGVGFSGNLYLLDSQKHQVWKYINQGGGLAEPSGYLKAEVDLSQAQDLAIDGLVWILSANNRIQKFVRGQPDAFSLVGLNQPLSQVTQIYTDENLENLYILDPKTTRIVVTDKQGEFKAEYLWSGLAGAKAMFADEEKGIILVLTGERIFKLKL